MGTEHIEKAILGYMIESTPLDSRLLRVDHFTSDKHRTIYRVIQAIKAEGKNPDLVLLTQRLTDLGQLASGEKQGVEPSYLTSLDQDIIRGPTAETHFKNYVNELITAYNQSQVEAVISNATKVPGFLPEIKKILETHELESVEPIETSTVAANVDNLERFIEKRRTGDFWGFNVTCFPRFTTAIMGLREIMVLIADEKIGKSMFVLQVANDIASQGYPVIYYDFENGRENLMARLACLRGKIRYNTELFQKVEEGNQLDINIRASLNSLRHHLKNFAIITDRRLTIDRIRSQIYQMKQMTGQERILVIFDSLQKCPIKDLSDRRAAIDRWLRDFEELRSEDPDLTLLIVSEVSREKKLPKESGSIEYTAHFLLRMRRGQEPESPDGPEPPDDGRRRLFLERARDVESSKPIAVYNALFEYWKLEEVAQKF